MQHFTHKPDEQYYNTQHISTNECSGIEPLPTSEYISLLLPSEFISILVHMIRYLQNVPYFSPQLRTLRLRLIQRYIQQQAEILAKEQVYKYTDQLSDEQIQYAQRYIQQHIVLATHKYINSIFNSDNTKKYTSTSSIPPITYTYTPPPSLLSMLRIHVGTINTSTQNINNIVLNGSYNGFISPLQSLYNDKNNTIVSSSHVSVVPSVLDRLHSNSLIKPYQDTISTLFPQSSICQKPLKTPTLKSY